MSLTAPAGPGNGTDQPTPDTAQVLLVEDSDTYALLAASQLQHRPSAQDDGLGLFVVTRVASLAAAGVALEESAAPFDAILLDLTLPDAGDLEALHALLAITDVPIVVLTGTDDVDRAVAAMRAGAQDYLLKTSTAPTDLARALRFTIARVQMAAELAEAREARDLAVTRLNDFLTLTAHEMLSPLTTVSGMGDTLVRRWDDVPPDTRQRMVKSMTSMAGVVVTISKQLLSLAKEKEGTAPTPDTVDSAVAEAVHDAALMARVEVEDLTEGVVARVDPDHLRLMLRNLFSNARRYGRPPIEVSTRRDGSDVVVTVRDHGPGVAEEDLDKLFTRWAGSSAKGSHGLGLYLARLLADANGGSLSYVGGRDGAAFDLCLPAP